MLDMSLPIDTTFRVKQGNFDRGVVGGLASLECHPNIRIIEGWSIRFERRPGPLDPLPTFARRPTVYSDEYR